MHAQDPFSGKTVTLPGIRTTLYEALNLVSANTEYLFIYDSETVKSDKRVKLRAGCQPLQKALEEILADPQLAFRVVGKHILIYRKANTTPAGRMLPPIPGMEAVKGIVIRGRVSDRESREPIPYASVGITGGNIGTITNSDGFFLLRLPDTLASAGLTVSHVGYQARAVPVGLLDGSQADLFLDRRVISVQEVIIRYLDPEVILRRALEQRSRNCPPGPVCMTAFYREGVRRNDACISYSEAVFRVYKTPWDAVGQGDQLRLMKSRRIKDPERPDTVFLKLKAGVQSALQLDIVKSLPGFLDPVPSTEYTYGYSNLVSYGGSDAYAVTFVQNRDIEKALYTGTVYVERDSFAILGAEFEINPRFLDQAVADFVLKKSPRLIVKLKKISYSVSYKSFNGRYYLNHARCEMEVTTRLRHHFKSDRFTTFLEFAACAIDTSGVTKIPRQEQFRPGTVFSEQPFTDDAGFWGEYNIISPEAGLQEALSGIARKLKEIR